MTILVTEDPDEIAQYAYHFLSEDMWDDPCGSGKIVFENPDRIFKLAVIPEIGWSMFCRIYCTDAYSADHPLLSTFVLPAFRRRGWGTNLVLKLIENDNRPFVCGYSRYSTPFYYNEQWKSKQGVGGGLSRYHSESSNQRLSGNH